MKSNRFYLACLRDTCGSNMSFHGKNSGYVTDVRKAREYTREEAQRAWDTGREFDLPVCADRVDALTVFHVDHQFIPYESEITEDCSAYVCFLKGSWDGNDVYWLTDSSKPSTDFSQAKVFSKPDIGNDRVVWIPFEMADAKKRPTFNIGLLNKRKMVQAAGLLTPEYIKRNSRRRTHPKTRFNSPACGKWHWQHDPHAFHGCKDHDCVEHNPYL